MYINNMFSWRYKIIYPYFFGFKQGLSTAVPSLHCDSPKTSDKTPQHCSKSKGYPERCFYLYINRPYKTTHKELPDKEIPLCTTRYIFVEEFLPGKRSNSIRSFHVVALDFFQPKTHTLHMYTGHSYR